MDLGSVLGLGSLLLQGADLLSSSSARREAAKIREEEAALRAALRKGYIDIEGKRIKIDKELEDTIREGLVNLSAKEREEMSAERAKYRDKMSPFYAEQEQKLKDPAAYNRMLNSLMGQSPYAARAAENIATNQGIVDNSMQTRGIPQGSLRDSIKDEAARSEWKDAISGFNNTYDKRQREAVGSLRDQYRDILGGIANKYDPKRRELNDKLASGLNYSDKLGNLYSTAFGMESQGAQERFANREKRADEEARERSAYIRFFGDLADNERDAYNNKDEDVDPRDYLMESFMLKNAGLNDSERKQYNDYKRVKRAKNRRFSILDLLNNRGVGGQNAK